MARRPVRSVPQRGRRQQGQALKSRVPQRRPLGDLLLAPFWGLVDGLNVLFGPLIRLLPEPWVRRAALLATIPYEIGRTLSGRGGITWLWLGTLAVLILEKAIWVGSDPYYSSAYRGFISAAHDGLLVALVCLFLGLSLLVSQPWGRALIRLPALGILLAMLGDLGVRTTFAFRLNLEDLLPYFDLPTAQKIAASSPLVVVVAGIMLLVMLAFALSLSLARRTSTGATWLVSVGLLGLIAYGLTPDERQDVYSWQWENVLAHNIFRGVDRPLSGDDEREGPDFVPRCEPVDSDITAYDKVILLVVESLSSYQSGYLSGLNNWTPSLDEIARNSWVFSNFHANGFNTAGGLIALLAGRVPVPPAGGGDLPGGQAPLFRLMPADGNRSLLKLMHDRGWKTHFLTSGESSFSGKKDWLEKLEFAYIEDATADFYEGRRDFVFNGAADEYLYDRTLELVSDARPPWFMAMETISTHPPYKDPESGEYSLEKTMRYADRQLKVFVDRLEEQGFFGRDGMLIITGDHHSMHRPSGEERALRSRHAASWIPLLIYGGKEGEWAGKNRRTIDLYQQTDLYNGLRSLVSGTSCTNRWRGDAFTESPADCIYYAPGGNRSYLRLHCGNYSYTLHLNGDDTGSIYGAELPRWVLPQLKSWRLQQ